MTFLLKGYSGQPVSNMMFLLKGDSGQPVSNVTNLLKGHSGQSVSKVMFLLKGHPSATGQDRTGHVFLLLVQVPSELSAEGAKQGVRFLQLPNWTPPDNPF